MKPFRPLVLCLGQILACVCAGQESAIIRQAESLEQKGQFKEAAALLTKALAEPSPASGERKKLEFELDRLDRIRKDYSHTRDGLFASLRKSVKGITAEEFDRWIDEGRFDMRTIDGERRFMVSSVSNLFFRYSELNSRRTPPKDTTKAARAALENCIAIKKEAKAGNTPYVLPKRFRVTMTVTAKANAVPDGEMVRAWLPIPRDLPFQVDFSLRSSSPEAKQINPPNSLIRAVHLEQPARKDRATAFKIEYDYTTFGVRFYWKPELIKPIDPAQPDLAPYLREASHVVFTPEIRALSEKIAGNEPNAALKAKLFHDWIAANIQYSFSTEYSTIRNISEYTRSHGYGDCGQEALLFITLCRLNGIPARWQSGWNTNPNGKTIHDWCEIHLAPYGWMPVDPYMGIFAMRYAQGLTTEQKKELRDFYFGGLDQYRMIANSDHNQELVPPKSSFRSDDVDFQRGELEWNGRNLYFDQYSYDLSWKETKPSPSN
jgi:transglutaminase-like putative cysteine protease